MWVRTNLHMEGSTNMATIITRHCGFQQHRGIEANGQNQQGCWAPVGHPLFRWRENIRVYICNILQPTCLRGWWIRMNSCLILTTKTDRDFGYKDIKRPAFERWRCSSGFLPVGTFHLYRIYFTTCVVVHSRLGLGPAVLAPGVLSRRSSDHFGYIYILLKEAKGHGHGSMSVVAQYAAACAVWAGVLVAATPGSATCLPDAIPASSSPGVKSTGAMLTDLNNWPLTTQHATFGTKTGDIDQEDAHVADSFSEIIISHPWEHHAWQPGNPNGCRWDHVFPFQKTSHFPGHIFKALSALRRKLVGLVTWYRTSATGGAWLAAKSRAMKVYSWENHRTNSGWWFETCFFP